MNAVKMLLGLEILNTAVKCADSETNKAKTWAKGAICSEELAAKEERWFSEDANTAKIRRVYAESCTSKQISRKRRPDCKAGSAQVILYESFVNLRYYLCSAWTLQSAFSRPNILQELDWGDSIDLLGWRDPIDLQDRVSCKNQIILIYSKKLTFLFSLLRLYFNTYYVDIRHD